MPKIKLGTRPETFKPFPVKFTMPDGSEGAITATYRYRTRTEFGALLDEAYAEAGEERPADAKAIDYQSLYSGIANKNAEHLMRSLAAWDVDAELSLDTLKQLTDELPAAAAALMAAYATACNEGRLGN